MDYRSLVNKLEAIQAGTYIKEATAPLSFTPTHFHKGNLGNKLPVMMTEPGVFWWEGGNQGGEMGGSGSRIVPWQGDAENRSGWNPASIDGEIKDGKYIDYPEGTTWKTAKAASDSDAALMAKLKQLVELVGKYVALKAKRGQGAKPAGPTTQNMGDGSRLTTDAKGNVAATDDEGNAYIPGSNPNLPKNKVAEGVIAKGLMESFGYQLDELTNTMDPNNPNAAFRNMPGAGQVANDLGGGNTLGSVGRERAQRAADQALQRGRTASADALTAFKPGAATTVAGAAPAVSTGAKTAVATGAKAATGAAGKLLGRAMPGVGAVLGAQGAIDSYKKGDYLGAALNGLSGAFSLVPGLGWVPALGLGAWQAGRELSGATDKYDNPGAAAGQGGTPPSGAASTDVKALQQRILAKDPKALPQHGADGRMGPETQAAMKRLNIKENIMPQKSLAETMRDLQQRLTMLEEPSQEIPPVVEPTPEELATAETAKQLGAEIGKVGDEVVIIAKDKTIIDPETKEILVNNGGQLAGTGKTYEPAMAEGYNELDESLWGNLFKGAARLGRTGAVVGKRAARVNPGKAALGVGAAGLAGGYATGSAGGSSTPPATTTPPVRPPATGGQGGTPATPDTSADDAELAALKAQIDALIKELSTSKNPEIQKGLADIQTKLQ